MSVLSRKDLTTAYYAEHTGTAQHSTAQHSTVVEVRPFFIQTYKKYKTA